MQDVTPIQGLGATRAKNAVLILQHHSTIKLPASSFQILTATLPRLEFGLNSFIQKEKTFSNRNKKRTLRIRFLFSPSRLCSSDFRVRPPSWRMRPACGSTGRAGRLLFLANLPLAARGGRAIETAPIRRAQGKRKVDARERSLAPTLVLEGHGFSHAERPSVVSLPLAQIHPRNSSNAPFTIPSAVGATELSPARKRWVAPAARPTTFAQYLSQHVLRPATNHYSPITCPSGRRASHRTSNRNYYGLEIDLTCCKQSPLIFSNRNKTAHPRVRFLFSQTAGVRTRNPKRRSAGFGEAQHLFHQRRHSKEAIVQCFLGVVRERPIPLQFGALRFLEFDQSRGENRCNGPAPRDVAFIQLEFFQELLDFALQGSGEQAKLCLFVRGHIVAEFVRQAGGALQPFEHTVAGPLRPPNQDRDSQPVVLSQLNDWHRFLRRVESQPTYYFRRFHSFTFVYAVISLCCLTGTPARRYRTYMAQSILIFDFGTNEESAQVARHKIEGWKQAFRLGNKVLLKFEREESEKPAEKAAEEAGTPPAKQPKGKKKSSAPKPEKEAKDAKAEPPAKIKVLIRLDFSDHEKLSHQRWLDRIPAEEPFKSASAEILRNSDAAFAKASEHFDALD